MSEWGGKRNPLLVGGPPRSPHCTAHSQFQWDKEWQEAPKSITWASPGLLPGPAAQKQPCLCLLIHTNNPTVWCCPFPPASLGTGGPRVLEQLGPPRDPCCISSGSLRGMLSGSFLLLSLGSWTCALLLLDHRAASGLMHVLHRGG